MRGGGGEGIYQEARHTGRWIEFASSERFSITIIIGPSTGKAGRVANPKRWLERRQASESLATDVALGRGPPGRCVHRRRRRWDGRCEQNWHQHPTRHLPRLPRAEAGEGHSRRVCPQETVPGRGCFVHSAACVSGHYRLAGGLKSTWWPGVCEEPISQASPSQASLQPLHRPSLSFPVWETDGWRWAAKSGGKSER
jgi:hypothetical protein